MPSRWLTAAALALIVGAPGCFTLDLDDDGDIDIPPSGGFETDELSCANGRDDDLDGRIDCEDSDCLMNGHCGEQIPLLPPVGYEDTFETCSNGIDDDLDGQFDCGDRGCQAIFELCCNLEFDDASCSNLLDDDGNGFADCRDFSCRNNPYVTVCDRERDCSNGEDDDGDRLADCRDDDCDDDPACNQEVCDNGVDDDDDGEVDCRDPGCADDPDCVPEADCTDGVDDNASGETDCADPSCYEDPACLGPESSLEFCSDGNDNDGNRFVDCGDFGCTMASRGASPEAIMFCMSRPPEVCDNGVDDDFDGDTDCRDDDCETQADCAPERSMADCFDGVDNDGDGFTDCDDFSCNDVDRGDAIPAVAQACQDFQESTIEECSNGIDDDGDGFTDCGDFSCSRAADPAVVDFCRRQGESNFAACIDRRDNNDNGFVDCADFSCRFTVVSYGARLCNDDADCPGGRRCNSTIAGTRAPVALSAEFCEIVACPGGDGSQCPSGTTCQTLELEGGSAAVCIETCSNDTDCAPGDSCYRGLCLSLLSPCFETTSVDEDTDLQGVDDEDQDIFQESTLEEQRRMVFRSCTDGIDGDRDGFTDCEDWECNHNPLAVDPVTGEPICRFAGGRTCILGPNAGQRCDRDEDCAGAVSGACSRPGPAGREFVCP
jgi:hypothetical protein